MRNLPRIAQDEFWFVKASGVFILYYYQCYYLHNLAVSQALRFARSNRSTGKENKRRHHLRCGATSEPSHTATPPWSFPLAFFGSARRLPFPPPPPWPAPGRRSRRRRPRRPRRRRRPSPRRCCWPRYAWWGSPWWCRSATDPPTPASSTPPASTTDTVSGP